MTNGDARDRPARLGHRPLLRAPQDRPAHRRPDDRGLQQDLRHRPPDGAVGVEPADPPVAGLRPARRARRRVLRGGRLGAAVLVRHERGAARRVRRPGHAARGRVGVALVVADHQRRAPRDARPGRAWSTCRRSRSSTSPGPARWPPSSGCASTRSTSPSGGPSTRRCSTRPAGSSPTSRSCGSAHDRFRVVTGGGMGMRDRKIFQDALPADGSAQLHDVTNAFTTFGLWGPRARDILGAASDGSADISHKRLPVPVVEDGRHRRRPDARVADQLRRRARLGDLRPDRAGPAGLGRALARRPAARPGPGRDRHVRGDVAAREGLPRPRRRARARLRPRRGRHGPTDAQGRRLRRASGLRASSDRRPPVAILCTLTVDDPTSSSGRQALHARPRADPDARRPADRRREGPRLVRDERRLRAVGRQAPADDVPAARARQGRARSSSSSTSASATR